MTCILFNLFGFVIALPIYYCTLKHHANKSVSSLKNITSQIIGSDKLYVR